MVRGQGSKPLPAIQTTLRDLRWLKYSSPGKVIPAQLQRDMTKFHQLRHLELECSSVKLPDLAGLSQLTALVFSNCDCMTQLPTGISSLTSLACLDCSRCVCTHDATSYLAHGQQLAR